MDSVGRAIRGRYGPCVDQLQGSVEKGGPPGKLLPSQSSRNCKSWSLSWTG